MRSTIFFFGFLLCAVFINAQDYKSIQQLESENQKSISHFTQDQFDSINVFKQMHFEDKTESQLIKKVFGYHPYWGGSNYLNYQWNLLSDFCHFSYEVDPATGNPTDVHDWETSAVIDSALANNVKVHLCVILFSGHATFFNSPDAQQTLISNVINLIESRGAHGVNMDVEALPSANKDAFTDFMINFCNQLHAEIPGAEMSMAAPAVNWNDKINIPVLNQYLDFYVVMGYDYYWSGSGVAGPVSPLYSMTGSYNYNFSKTISYYQSQGVPNERIIMAVPYYAYQWETEGQFAPSSTLETAAPKTYRYIKDNATGNYVVENKHREPNSFGPYYAFETESWYQCFIDDTYSMGEKYDIVNRRNLGGIGIWALGYDNGYSELWDLIDQKFTDNASVIAPDTIYDTGGPGLNYYNNESYTFTISVDGNSKVYLLFLSLNLEENYDTLWIFDGPDELSPLIDFYSADSIPSLITSTSNSLTLKFYSDGATTEAGWMAVYDTIELVQDVGGVISALDINLKISPNPFTDYFNIEFKLEKLSEIQFWITDISSQKRILLENGNFPAGKHSIFCNEKLQNLPPGVWMLNGKVNNRQILSRKIIKNKS